MVRHEKIILGLALLLLVTGCTPRTQGNAVITPECNTGMVTEKASGTATVISSPLPESHSEGEVGCTMVYVYFDYQDGSDDRLHSTYAYGPNGPVHAWEPKREGYCFVGWYTEPECINKVEEPIHVGDVKLSKDTHRLTLYAKWEPAFITPNITVTPAKTPKVTAKPTPTTTLLPVTERTDMLKGTAVQATVRNTTEDIFSPTVNDVGDFRIDVVQDLEELKTAYIGCEIPGDGKIESIFPEYDEEYFRENAIILVRTRRTHADTDRIQYSLVKSKGELCVGMSFLPHPPIEEGIPTTEVLPMNTCLQVKKSDIADIDKLSYFQYDDKVNS